MKINLLLLSIALLTFQQLYSQGVSEAWQKEFGELINDNDAADKLAVDTFGNSYVMGLSHDNLYNSGEITTIKYNNNGVQQWVTTIDGTCSPGALGIDNSGNVLITFSELFNSDHRAVTVKYNSSGQQLWLRTYSSGYNFPVGIAFDHDDNVYVAGIGADSIGNIGALLLKYDKDGQQIWNVSYYAFFANISEVEAMTSDGQGNLFLCGSGWSGTEYRFITSRFNKDGTHLWTSTYSYPSALGVNSLHDITLDDSGNAFETGAVKDSYGNYYSIVIKYDSSGTQQWATIHGDGVKVYDGGKITTDHDGNAYMAALRSDGVTTSNFLTIKYNSSGQQQWQVEFITNYLLTYPSGMLIDDEDNIYISGSSFTNAADSNDFTIVKYNNSGIQQWAALYNGSGNGSDIANAISLNGDGNVYAAGIFFNSSNDFGMVKYNGDGVLQWACSYNTEKQSSNATHDMNITSGGGICVAGQSEDSTMRNTLSVVKYSENGDQLWSAQFQGTASEFINDVASAVVSDGAGNILVCGTVTDSSDDFVTIKYGNDGILQWAKIYDGADSGNDAATAMTIDGAGNVYVTGITDTQFGGGKLTTIKYGSDGSQQWVQNYAFLIRAANAIAVDNNGNVYVAGFRLSDSLIIIKYNSNGIVQWERGYFVYYTFHDFHSALAIDAGGNVYITGDTHLYGQSDDFITIKYNSSGEQQWAVGYDGDGNGIDHSRDIAVDDFGNVFVTGLSFNSVGNYDFVTIRYDSNGVQQWVNAYDGTGHSTDMAYDITIDVSGNAYVTGSSHSDNGDDVYVTVKYNTSGTQQWIVITDNGVSNIPAKLAVNNSNGSVYVTGTSMANGGSRFFTVKYIDSTFTGMDEEGNISLLNIFPNPVNDQLTLQFPESSSASLLITNLIGEKMPEQKVSNTTSLQLNVKNFPPGVYFLYFTDGKKRRVTKEFVKM